MVEDMVMRSVYLRPGEDSQLRQLAHELNVTKSDLIRSAISAKLRDWLDSNDDELVMRDLELGRRDTPTERVAKAAAAAAPAQPVKPAPAKPVRKAPDRMDAKRRIEPAPRVERVRSSRAAEKDRVLEGA